MKKMKDPFSNPIDFSILQIVMNTGVDCETLRSVKLSDLLQKNLQQKFGYFQYLSTSAINIEIRKKIKKFQIKNFGRHSEDFFLLRTSVEANIPISTEEIHNRLAKLSEKTGMKHFTYKNVQQYFIDTYAKHQKEISKTFNTNSHCG